MGYDQDSSRIHEERIYFTKLYRDRAIKWFRYQNNRQHAAREDHSSFIGILSILEEYAGKEFFNGKYGWKDCLESIKSLSLDQLEEINRRIERFKSEKLGARIR